MGICLLTYKGELKFADGIKVANQLSLRWENILRLSRWAQCNDKGPYKWKREAGEKRDGSLRSAQPNLLALKMEEGAMSQGTEVRKQILF